MCRMQEGKLVNDVWMIKHHWWNRPIFVDEYRLFIRLAFSDLDPAISRRRLAKQMHRSTDLVFDWQLCTALKRAMKRAMKGFDDVTTICNFYHAAASSNDCSPILFNLFTMRAPQSVCPHFQLASRLASILFPEFAKVCWQAINLPNRWFSAGEIFATSATETFSSWTFSGPTSEQIRWSRLILFCLLNRWKLMNSPDKWSLINL